MKHEFVYSKFAKTCAYIFGFIFIAGACYCFNQAITTNKKSQFYTAGAVTLVLGLYVALNAYRKKVTVTDDAISLQGTFKTQSLAFKAAKGYKLEKTHLVIEPTAKQDPIIFISDYGYLKNSDQLLSLVQRKLRNTVQVSYNDDLNKLMQDPKVGSTKKERQSRLRKVSKLTSYLNNIAIAIALWVFIYPHPYDVALVTALVYPLITLIIIYKNKDIITLDVDDESNAYPTASKAFLLPAGVLVLRALINYDFVNFTDCLLPCCLTAVIIIALMVMLFAPQNQPKNSQTIWIMTILFALIYGYGATVCINCNFDYKPSQKHKVIVIDKHVSSGKHTTYYLNISKWGNRKDAEDESVYKTLYQQTKIGDTLIIYQKRGLLHIPWYFVDN